MFMPKPNEGGTFTPAPAGAHAAVCIKVIDLGTQTSEYQGKTTTRRKIEITWELPNELMDDGRPFTIRQRYSFSSHEKSTLRKHLESWRGRKFQDSDFGPGGFHLSKLIGVPCMLTVVHNDGEGGRTFANIQAVSPLPKGMPKPQQHNGTQFFSLEPGEFDQGIFQALPDWQKELISKSPEWHHLHTPDADAHAPADEMSDEIPF